MFRINAALRGDIERLPQGVFQSELGEIDVVRGKAGIPDLNYGDGYG